MSSRPWPVWRVWFRHHAGVEVYVDVEAIFGSQAVQAGCEAMRERAGGSLTGWWPHRWQNLWPVVGDPARPGKDHRHVVGPPLRRRLFVARRRLLRRLRRPR